MATDWKFVTPRGHLTIFYFGSLGDSRRYNFMQVWVAAALKTYFPIMPSSPELHRILPERSPVEYTLKTFAQIPGSSNATQSGIEASEIPSTKPGYHEWLLRIQGDEGREIQIGLLTTPVEPAYGNLSGDGRLIYKTRSAKRSRASATRNK